MFEEYVAYNVKILEVVEGKVFRQWHGDRYSLVCYVILTLKSSLVIQSAVGCIKVAGGSGGVRYGGRRQSVYSLWNARRVCLRHWRWRRRQRLLQFVQSFIPCRLILVCACNALAKKKRRDVNVYSINYHDVLEKSEKNVFFSAVGFRKIVKVGLPFIWSSVYRCPHVYVCATCN